MQNVISKDAKIAVLCGGMSSEKEVSMRSGKGCFEALKRLGFKNAELVVVDENIAQTLKNGKFDVAYNALHGKFGEDGCIQGLLEFMGIPYTGSGVKSSAICMDKCVTKEILNSPGLPAFTISIAFAARTLKESEEWVAPATISTAAAS